MELNTKRSIRRKENMHREVKKGKSSKKEGVTEKNIEENRKE
jgi:hypothetical protein